MIRLTQWRVAKAIDIARERGAHVITMSLGGFWSWFLRGAVKRAEAANILVLAAAGNCVPFVVYPARFRDCLAVAGTSPEIPENGWDSESPWVGSARGKPVDVSAPGQFVWCAARKPDQSQTDAIGAGEGTSFSVALTAGVAALWLERHGRDALINQLEDGETLMDMFREAITATARTTPPLGDNMGSGIVDALALLGYDVTTRPKRARVTTVNTDDLVQHTLDMLGELSERSETRFRTDSLHRDIAPVALAMQSLILKRALSDWDMVTDPIAVSGPAAAFLEVHPDLRRALQL